MLALAVVAATSTVGSPSATASPSASPELVPFQGSFTITATWGAPSGGYHDAGTPAIDTAMPVGTPIYAAGAGTVSLTRVDARNCNPNTYPGGVSGCLAGGFEGTQVHISHPDSTSSRYAHLSRIADGITKGTVVTAGQLIGYSGNTGTSTGPHLHYEERTASGAYQAVTTWMACRGTSTFTYDQMQNRKGQTVANDGYACLENPSADDTDGDGVPDATDICQGFSGPAVTRGCPSEEFDSSALSDFNGDGRTDVAAFYDYGSGHTKGWTISGTSKGLTGTTTLFWDSGRGNWDLNDTRLVGGSAITPILRSTSDPSVQGTVQVGQKLTASPGVWNLAATYSYQWLANGKSISGATSKTYTPGASVKGMTISVRVTASRVGSLPVSATSKTAGPVKAGVLTSTPTPKVSGTAKVGKKLTAKAGTWKPSGVKLTYQWYANGKKISKATGTTLTLKTAQKGKKITLKVTAKKCGYTTVTKTSKATAKVA